MPRGCPCGVPQGPGCRPCPQGAPGCGACCWAPALARGRAFPSQPRVSKVARPLARRPQGGEARLWLPAPRTPPATAWRPPPEQPQDTRERPRAGGRRGEAWAPAPLSGTWGKRPSLNWGARRRAEGGHSPWHPAGAHSEVLPERSASLALSTSGSAVGPGGWAGNPEGHATRTTGPSPTRGPGPVLSAGSLRSPLRGLQTSRSCSATAPRASRSWGGIPALTNLLFSPHSKSCWTPVGPRPCTRHPPTCPCNAPSQPPAGKCGVSPLQPEDSDQDPEAPRRVTVPRRAPGWTGGGGSQGRGGARALESEGPGHPLCLGTTPTRGALSIAQSHGPGQARPLQTELFSLVASEAQFRWAGEVTGVQPGRRVQGRLTLLSRSFLNLAS